MFCTRVCRDPGVENPAEGSKRADGSAARRDGDWARQSFRYIYFIFLKQYRQQ